MQANTLEINTILMQFLNWMSYGVDGFAYAAESLVGKYLGASNKEKLKLGYAHVNQAIVFIIYDQFIFFESRICQKT